MTQTVEEQVSNLVNASNQLTATVENKVQEIDSKVDTAINEVRSNLTILSTNTLRKQVEAVSGGRNTVIIDAQGNENVMCVVPRFNVEDLGLTSLNLGVGTHPAFITDGAPRSEILVAKYLASSGLAGGCSVVGGAQPMVNVDYDQSKLLCTQKGVGWHMMSIHEWAALGLWAKANGTEPRGNTNYGRSHENKLETAIRADNRAPGDAAGTGSTATGTGPASWGHDGTEFGVQDLTGNVWEWLDQMKLDNGQIITTPDNNGNILEANWTKHTAFFDSVNANKVGNIGSPRLNSSVVNRNGALNDDGTAAGYAYNTNFAAITKEPSYVANELLRRLLIESATAENAKGALWVRNYGERFPLRGGHWSYAAGAGVGALDLLNARSDTYSNIGFRPAYFV